MQINNSTSGISSSGVGSGTGQSNSAASLSKLSDNMNNFLTLLTTQLQYQDPLSPMDTYQFTNQLVQFASVEQSIQSNRNLESLISLQQSNLMVGAVSYIGKDIEASGQTAKLKDGKAEFTYTLPKDAKAALLMIKDANGTPVSSQLADTSQGNHTFIWDGKNSSGNAMPDGNYTIQVGATDANDQAINPTYAIRGTVTGVGVQNGAPQLDLGGLQIPLANVMRVIDPASGAS